MSPPRTHKTNMRRPKIQHVEIWVFPHFLVAKNPLKMRITGIDGCGGHQCIINVNPDN
jgi:hypothetical protein